MCLNVLILFSLYVFCALEDVAKADSAPSEAAATSELGAKWN